MKVLWWGVDAVIFFLSSRDLDKSGSVGVKTMQPTTTTPTNVRPGLVVPEFMADLLPVVDESIDMSFFKPDRPDGDDQNPETHQDSIKTSHVQTIDEHGHETKVETKEVVVDGKVVDQEVQTEKDGKTIETKEVLGSDVIVSRFMMKGRRSYMEDFIGDDIASQNYKQVYDRLLTGNPIKKIDNMIKHRSLVPNVESMLRNLLGDEVMSVNWMSRLKGGLKLDNLPKPRTSRKKTLRNQDEEEEEVDNEQNQEDDSGDETSSSESSSEDGDEETSPSS